MTTPHVPDRPASRRPIGACWRLWAVLAGACALVAIGLLATSSGSGGDGDVATGPAPSSTTTAPASTTSTAPSTTAAPATAAPKAFPSGVAPARLVIPAIGVDAPTVDLDLRGAAPEVPEDFGATGWYAQTRRPGEIGPAVIAGHIDSTTGPAVFYGLRDLRPDDEVVVVGESGDERRFVVIGSGQYPKGDLPDEVFAFGDAVPELRLITCGGTFDRASGHYRDNYVVYARAA